MAYNIRVDMATCDGNGSCTEVCPQGCFLEPEGGKAALAPNYDCIGCEGCVSACPKSAIVIVEA